MQVKARNMQSALKSFMDKLGTRDSIDEPLMVILTHPREKVMVWTGWGNSPAQELCDALLSLRQVRKIIPNLASKLGELTPGFHLQSPIMSVSFELTEKKEVTVTAVTPETDVSHAAFGPMMMQLSMLQELIASHAKCGVGTLTLVQLQARIPKRPVMGDEGYTDGVYSPIPMESAEDFWADLDMFLQQQDNAIGYKSLFIRKVAVPVVRAAKLAEDDPSEAKKALSSIAATDWRAAMAEVII